VFTIEIESIIDWSLEDENDKEVSIYGTDGTYLVIEKTNIASVSINA
jgi:hypothetical protein